MPHLKLLINSKFIIHIRLIFCQEFSQKKLKESLILLRSVLKILIIGSNFGKNRGEFS